MEKKELYKTPEIELEVFDTEDVITTSDEKDWSDWVPLSSRSNNYNGR